MWETITIKQQAIKQSFRIIKDFGFPKALDQTLLDKLETATGPIHLKQIQRTIILDHFDSKQKLIAYLNDLF